MFIARKNELRKVKSFLSSDDNAMLVYGKRRVGKTRLIKEALKDFDGIVVSYQCTAESYEINLEYFIAEVKASFSIQFLSFKTFYEAFVFFVSQKKRILVVIDEYGELKTAYGAYATDSMFQKIIDSLNGTDVKVIITGSAVGAMKELLDRDNPLYDRFGCIIHLNEFGYYDASLFYPWLSAREKVAFYSVFGGSPNVLERLDASRNLEENIKMLLLAPDGRVRSFVESSLIQEYSKIGPALSLFSMLGNDKHTYTEIKDKLDPSNTGNLSKQLSRFMDNDAIRKVSPINHKDEKKRTFYTLNENLMRFYFTYVHPNRSMIESVGEEAVFNGRIRESLNTYISYRFEEIVRSYFSRLAKRGNLPDIMDIGTYWYDDKKLKRNGEFDCVLEFVNGYDVYEAKYLEEPMSQTLAESEIEKIEAISDFKPRGIGFVSVSGFDFHNDNISLISGEDLYSEGNLAD